MGTIEDPGLRKQVITNQSFCHYYFVWVSFDFFADFQRELGGHGYGRLRDGDGHRHARVQDVRRRLQEQDGHQHEAVRKGGMCVNIGSPNFRTVQEG